MLLRGVGATLPEGSWLRIRRLTDGPAGTWHHAIVDARTVGLLIAGLGVVAIVVGLVVMTGAVSWVGRLPGDIRYESGNTRVYVPITTMIVLSVVASVIAYLLRHIL
ncbi:MAG: DUF2905 domain-containing protein [Tepidiformaceae bacterium]